MGLVGFLGFRREGERENAGEQNLFFPCCVSKGRKSTMPFKTTLFCALFFLDFFLIDFFLYSLFFYGDPKMGNNSVLA